MRKVLLVIIYINVSIFGFAEKSKDDLVLVKEWSEGNFYDETSCPTAWLFDDNNNIYKVEPDTSILRIYKSNFEKADVIEADYNFMGADMYWSGFGALLYFRSGKYYILKTHTGNTLTLVSEPNVADGHGVFGNLLILEDLNGTLNGCIIPTNTGEEIIKMNGEELKTYINSNTNILEGLSLDDQGIPLFRGIPFTRTGFKKYWNVKLGYFNAIDQDLNTSYRNQIRDKTGRILESFGSESEYFGRLTLDHEGNAFFFQGNKTFYIGRDWGYANIRDGEINDNNVRIRLHPGTQEFILGKIDKGEIVEVLYETEEKYTIGNMFAPWFKVKLKSGLVGWVFGSYVDQKKNY